MGDATVEELQAALAEAEGEKVKLAEIGQHLLGERQIAQQNEQEAREKLEAANASNQELAAKYDDICEQLRTMREERDALEEKADELERLKVDLDDDLQEAISRSSDFQVRPCRVTSGQERGVLPLFFFWLLNVGACCYRPRSRSSAPTTTP